jgi:hypothetical protein
VQVADGFGDLGKGIGPIDDGRELAVFDELPQDLEVLLRLGGGERSQPLADEQRHNRRPPPSMIDTH